MVDSIHAKKVLLTGASRGIGRACAQLLIEQGAAVLGVGRDPSTLKQTELELKGLGPGSFTAFCADVAAEGAAESLREQVERCFGELDIAVFNAAVMDPGDGDVMKISEDVLLTTMNVNLMAPFRAARALLPLLLLSARPRIINVGSGAGSIELMTDDGIAAYRLSKWSLHGLTMLQARELHGKVCVNAFDPGWIKTDLGGPNAPGTPEEAARGLLRTLSLPWDRSGGFFKDGKEIPW